MLNLKKIKIMVFVFIFLFFQTNLISQILGCTDPLSTNYNPIATINDGSCIYPDRSISVNQSWDLLQSLIETSGLIYFDNKLWTHNDNTDTNLYLLDKDSLIDRKSDYYKIKLKNVLNIDWEEISQDENYIYIGDFGNNATGIRKDLKIYKIDKKTIYSNEIKIDTINFEYSNQIDFTNPSSNETDFDCEAFIVSKDSIYLFTKEWNSNKTSIYTLPKLAGNYKANYSDSYEIDGLITGATFIEKSKVVVLCGYSSLLQPFIYLLYDFDNNKFFSGNKRKIGLSLAFHQIEGITSNNGLDYYLSNEKFERSILTVQAKLHTLNLKEFLSNYLDKINTSIEGNSNNIIDVNDVLYPNPTNGTLEIKYYIPDSNIFQYVITDLIGHTLISNSLGYKKSGENYDIIDVNILKQGQYNLRLYSKTKQFNFKFIRER